MPTNPRALREDTWEEKCLLYSGILVGLQQQLVVLAGTVFSELVVWSVTDGMVKHRLKGHKGVIFSVSFNPEQLLIGTTSNDRSTRLWKVVFHVQNGTMSSHDFYIFLYISFIVNSIFYLQPGQDWTQASHWNSACIDFVSRKI